MAQQIALNCGVSSSQTRLPIHFLQYFLKNKYEYGFLKLSNKSLSIISHQTIRASQSWSHKWASIIDFWDFLKGRPHVPIFPQNLYILLPTNHVVKNLLSRILWCRTYGATKSSREGVLCNIFGAHITIFVNLRLSLVSD